VVNECNCDFCGCENRSVGETLVRKKAAKYSYFLYTTNLTGCHSSAKGLLLAEQAAICARIETFEPCVTEFGLWAEDQLSGGLTDGESLFN